MTSVAEELILTYMRQQNRPFALTDVHLNLKGAVTKPAAQKALLALADSGKLLKKEYGKSLLFLVKQNSLETLDKDGLTALGQETALKKQELIETKKLLAARQAEAETVAASPSNTQLVEQVALATAHCTALEKQLAELKSSGAKPMTDEEVAVYDKSLDFWRKAWISRRKAVKDLLVMVSDALGKEEVASIMDQFSITLEEDTEAEEQFVQNEPR
ncbi:TBPIP-domain-containing protein [Tilletiaria anomala UBC 951]|uniref:TBPIP-domain-containing protein n=1 Tax=Tilletiaria anomala (strain ATCC 24038 / CBS 436.72 / UBC 951) TaxID=1037660 RepID=A0A066WNI5_TILAU|nr:TBPIP-domain-containing protein [Tilletiaria anomala UBC 951]KDN52185.1 TBPIP-domain-containing protein [Tilletiaria anomala UBC 951]